MMKKTSTNEKRIYYKIKSKINKQTNKQKQLKILEALTIKKNTKDLMDMNSSRYI